MKTMLNITYSGNKQWAVAAPVDSPWGCIDHAHGQAEGRLPADEAFIEKIKEALTQKVLANRELRILLAQSGSIPIVHYYCYGTKVIVPSNWQWCWEHYMEIRSRLVKR